MRDVYQGFLVGEENEIKTRARSSVDFASRAVRDGLGLPINISDPTILELEDEPFRVPVGDREKGRRRTVKTYTKLYAFDIPDYGGLRFEIKDPKTMEQKSRIDVHVYFIGRDADGDRLKETVGKIYRQLGFQQEGQETHPQEGEEPAA